MERTSVLPCSPCNGTVGWWLLLFVEVRFSPQSSAKYHKVFFPKVTSGGRKFAAVKSTIINYHQNWNNGVTQCLLLLPKTFVCFIFSILYKVLVSACTAIFSSTSSAFYQPNLYTCYIWLSQWTIISLHDIQRLLLLVEASCSLPRMKRPLCVM